MKRKRIGSLFSGVAGLDRAVEQFFDADVAWFVEFDAAPSKVLAYHYPGVPNYGDVTSVDWASVEPVDILTGGFPCQDVSLAGARKGLSDGTRSGLWSEYAKAISILRPKLVIIENVRGLLSAKTIEEIEDNEADSDLEWYAGSVGGSDRVSGPILNAFGRVLADLAELGYDAEWIGLRAADAGAPHNRFRVFVVAYPAGERTDRRTASEDSDFTIGGERRVPASRQTEGGGTRSDAGGRSRTSTSDAASRGFDGRSNFQVRATEERTAAERGRANASPDADGDEPERIGGSGSVGSASGAGEGVGGQRERIRDASGDRGTVAPDPDDARRIEHGRTVTVREEHVATEHGSSIDWGAYAPAIERWEQVIGRSAPTPTRPDGRDGSHRLNPELTEWMMGWPYGWVTDPAIDLTRNEQLKVCGNGVVTQQALLALHILSRAC